MGSLLIRLCQPSQNRWDFLLLRYHLIWMEIPGIVVVVVVVVVVVIVVVIVVVVRSTVKFVSRTLWNR